MALEINKKTHWTELVLDDPPRNVLDRGTLESLGKALDNLSAAEAPLLF